jgi:hypothetical protein
VSERTAGYPGLPYRPADTESRRGEKASFIAKMTQLWCAMVYRQSGKGGFRWLAGSLTRRTGWKEAEGEGNWWTVQAAAVPGTPNGPTVSWYISAASGMWVL